MDGQDEDLVDVDPYDDGTGGFPEYDWDSARFVGATASGYPLG
jgi:hypothetical protein